MLKNMKSNMFLILLAFFFIVESCCASGGTFDAKRSSCNKLVGQLRCRFVRIQASDIVETVLKKNPQSLNRHSGFVKALKRADDCLARLEDDQQFAQEISTIEKAIEMIIDRRKALANVDVQDDQWRTALIQAARTDRPDISRRCELVEILLNADGDIDMPDEQGRTVLMRAAQAGRCRLVEILLEKGANPNAQDNEGFTAFMLGNNDTLGALIKNDANPDHVNHSGKTALMIAVDNRDDFFDHTAALLENGANPNIVDKDGNSALVFAAVNLNFNNFRVLLLHGADPNLQNKKEQTVLMFLVNVRGLGTGIRARPCIRLLLKRNINLDLADEYGNTALMHVARQLDVDYVCEFLEKGANPYLKNKNGLNALALAKNANLDLKTFCPRRYPGNYKDSAVEKIEEKLACDLEKKNKENLVRAFYQKWQQLVDKK